MHFWWQNLNEKDGKKGNPIRHGRARVWLNSNHGIGWSWQIPTHFCLARFEVGNMDGIVLFGFACWLFALWLEFDWPRPHSWRWDYKRELSLSIFDGALWWHTWADPDEWRSTDPKWRRGVFRPVDFLLGGEKCSHRTLSTHDVKVPLPEATYTGTVEVFESTWKRPRWPWPTKMVRTCIDVPAGVPIPGKGETGYDCEEDATYSLTSPAKTPQEAVQALIEDTMRVRRKYGGANWRPAQS